MVRGPSTIVLIVTGTVKVCGGLPLVKTRSPSACV